MVTSTIPKVPESINFVVSPLLCLQVSSAPYPAPKCNKFLVRIKERGFRNTGWTNLLPSTRSVQTVRYIIINVCQQSTEAAASKKGAVCIIDVPPERRSRFMHYLPDPVSGPIFLTEYDLYYFLSDFRLKITS